MKEFFLGLWERFDAISFLLGIIPSLLGGIGIGNHIAKQKMHGVESKEGSVSMEHPQGANRTSQKMKCVKAKGDVNMK